MRRWVIITVLLLFLVSAGAAGCNSFGGDEEEISQQLVKVVRGDLAIDVSGNGNIEASRDVKLSFGSGGRIDKISVEKGDEVSKGDVLARLDTDALELAITQAEVALAEKKLAITQAEVALTERQVAVAQAEVALTERQVAVTQAEVTLETAEYNLYEAKDTYVWVDIRKAQSDVDEAQRYLDDALRALDQATGLGVEFQQKIVIHAQSRLDTAKDILEAMLAGTDPQEVVIKKLEVKLTQESLELAQQSQGQAQQSLELAQQSQRQAQQSLELARRSVELAQQSLDQAQKQLDEATITTPFDGVVASVGAEEGDTISTATTIIHLVDLTSMELIMELDEIDMPGVRLNQEAIIEIDALPDITFEGIVTTIYPLPIEEGGVVLYNVKINLDVTEGSDLKIGMSASADIITDKRSNVLLVPNRAITQDSQGNPMIKVMVNEEFEERAVVTGISDGLQTEIISGLAEGESVVIETRVKPEPSGMGLF